MKIILSRKGFDSENGGQPSPILPNGELLSFPIPSKNDTFSYTNIFHGKKTYYQIICELNQRTKIKENYMCHLDPDLRIDTIDRVDGWTGLFGQQGSAEGHLKRNNIAVGDLFLFFGWFRETELVDGKLHYVDGARDLHIIYGYLQIGKMFIDANELPLFAYYHPHAKRYEQKNNCIYQANDYLTFDHSKPGYGVFNYKDERVLTMDGRKNRSEWFLPDIFKNVSITYHSKDSFTQEGFFNSAKKGQEFIVDANDEIIRYVCNSVF